MMEEEDQDKNGSVLETYFGKKMMMMTMNEKKNKKSEAEGEVES